MKFPITPQGRSASATRSHRGKSCRCYPSCKRGMQRMRPSSRSSGSVTCSHCLLTFGGFDRRRLLQDGIRPRWHRRSVGARREACSPPACLPAIAQESRRAGRTQAAAEPQGSSGHRRTRPWTRPLSRTCRCCTKTSECRARSGIPSRPSAGQRVEIFDVRERADGGRRGGLAGFAPSQYRGRHRNRCCCACSRRSRGRE